MDVRGALGCTTPAGGAEGTDGIPGGGVVTGTLGVDPKGRGTRPAGTSVDEVDQDDTESVLADAEWEESADHTEEEETEEEGDGHSLCCGLMLP